MREAATLGAILGAALVAVLWGPRASGEATGPAPTLRVVAERHGWFLEDEDGRRTARLTARLEAGPDGIRLRVEATAVAPGVEPPPGWEGIGGTNTITAREIGALVRSGDGGGTLQALDGEPTRRRIPPVAAPATRLSQRALGTDGRIDFAARTRDELPPACSWTTPPLAPGRYELTVETDGEVRLVCRVRVGEVDGYVLRLEGRARDLVRPGVSR